MGDIRAVIRALWADFTRNQRLYFLFLAGPAALVSILWMTHVVASPRWEQPLAQLEILKLVVLMLCLTHLVVVISMAAVRVSGRGPGGFSFDVDADEDRAPPALQAHVEGEVTLTPADGELPPEQRLPK